MDKNDHARLPSVNKNLFDKANCPAFIAVQNAINIASSQCKSHDAGATTQPMNEAYGAQLRRSTSLRRSTQPIHDRYDVPRPMPTGGAEQSSLPWNVIIYNSPVCSAAEPPYNSNGRLHLAFWQIQACRQSLIPGFEMGTQMFKVFSCSAQTCHLPALNASVRTTSRNASWSRKLSSAIVQTTSKNDYENEKINSQDSEIEDKKRDNQYSECDDKEETYTCYTTKHC